MLLWLAQYFQQDLGPLRVFHFITFRAVFATITALTIGLAAGPAVIRKLTAMKYGQAVRTDGPQTHLKKHGTPTMGGVLLLIAIGVSTLLWCDLSNRLIWPVLVVTIGFGAVGWVDDYRKVVRQDPQGMRSAEKYFWQSLVGIAAALYLAFSVSAPNAGSVFELFFEWVRSGFSMDLPPKADLIVPFFKTISYPVGVWGFIALTYCVIVGTSNAVNFTDGLDGLAIMPTIMVGAALGLFAYLTGNATYSRYLFIPHIEGAGELIIFCGALAGAGLAFLWFNTHPAQVFMGGIFVAETVSVIIQVGWFKFTKKRYGVWRRVFLMAPLHHHFEQKGWKETQVVVRFWIVTMMLVLVGLSTLKLR